MVPGGAISPDRTRWISWRPNFFLPVQVLARLFRRLILDYLRHAFDVGDLQFISSLEPLRTRDAFLRHITPIRKKDRVVYAKRPFAGPDDVLKYVARYTHASPSPMIACLISMTARFSFAGRIVDMTIAPRR